MERPHVSAIVPVYKAEQYLRDCIDSILAQSFSDFELILVEDGSPDGSGLICDAYASQDRRVKVIHKSNGGVSSARNAGLDAAAGEYVFFCDSDDWLGPTILEKGVTACSSGTDICAFGHVRVKDDETKSVRIDGSISCSTEELTEQQIIDLIQCSYITAPWGKLISRSLIADKRFDTDLTFGEDMVFMISLISQGCSIFASSETEYYYRDNQSGLTNNVSVNKCTSAVKAYEFLFRFAHEKAGSSSELSAFVRKRWADDFKEIIHQIHMSKESRSCKWRMLKILTEDRLMLAAAKENLSKQEKYECMVLTAKSLFPLMSSLLNRFIKRPEAYK